MLETPEITKPSADGSAYGRPVQHPNAELIGVKAGTPAGEWLRRYWHPIAVSDQVADTPRKVKLLGEDLIIFRNGKGEVGLLYPRCMHRGTSLYYGRVEEQGIRCCYHGWLFDTEGNCLEQPCEPGGGLRRDNARQPWYPVQERYGLVFAYMGPPDKIPVLPRYDILEDVEEGQIVYANGGGEIAYVDMTMKVDYAPYHWLQAFDNVMDPFHTWILHATFGPAQSYEGLSVKPTITFERGEAGVIYHAKRPLEGGLTWDRTNYAALPNIGIISPVTPRGSEKFVEGRAYSILWYVPADDEEWVGFAASKLPATMAHRIMGFYHQMTPDGRGWSQMTEEEHREYPGDFEAQSGQGTTTLHSEEHFAQSDIGVAMLRRAITEGIRAVQNGDDPIGVVFDEAKAIVKVPSGNFIR